VQMQVPVEPLPQPPASPDIAGATPNVDELGDVFFDYDKWDLRDMSRATLTRNAEWMKRWPNTRLLIEGQADVRGTNEYNFPLGQRRATAARDYLISLGISADRLVTATMGKTNLVCTSLDETCWQRNRRAHFSLLSK
jgi:peptidoglycan-associated lipoprotein